MANICNSCGKKKTFGNNVSHSNRKTRRSFKANLVTRTLLDSKTGQSCRQKICTACLRTTSKTK